VDFRFVLAEEDIAPYVWRGSELLPPPRDTLGADKGWRIKVRENGGSKLRRQALEWIT
jgi:hypothetical protein